MCGTQMIQSVHCRVHLDVWSRLLRIIWLDHSNRLSHSHNHLLGTFSCERSGVAFLSCCKRKSSSIAATVT